MNEDRIKQLIEKYNAGETSLEEEALLFKHIHKNDEKLAHISSFMESEKIEVPENLNEKLWGAFEEKIIEKKPNRVWRWSIAATVLLMLGLFVSQSYHNNKEELRKQALLEEAKSMFAEKNETLKMGKILYEDEILIVYTNNKK